MRFVVVIRPPMQSEHVADETTSGGREFFRRPVDASITPKLLSPAAVFALQLA
jgi:hypothetical protein